MIFVWKMLKLVIHKNIHMHTHVTRIIHARRVSDFPMYFGSDQLSNMYGIILKIKGKKKRKKKEKKKERLYVW